MTGHHRLHRPDPAEVRRADNLLDRIAKGRPVSRGHRAADADDLVVSLLGALRDEARAAPSDTRGMPARRNRRRAATLAVAVATSVSVTGVAAAAAGVRPLEPIRTVINQVAGVGEPRPDEAGQVRAQQLNEVIQRAETAFDGGDVGAGETLLWQARRLAETMRSADLNGVDARLAALELRLEKAQHPAPAPRQQGGAVTEGNGQPPITAAVVPSPPAEGEDPARPAKAPRPSTPAQRPPEPPRATPSHGATSGGETSEPDASPSTGSATTEPSPTPAAATAPAEATPDVTADAAWPPARADRAPDDVPGQGRPAPGPTP